jgi:hypothetical protein
VTIPTKTILRNQGSFELGGAMLLVFLLRGSSTRGFRIRRIRNYFRCSQIFLIAHRSPDADPSG